MKLLVRFAEVSLGCEDLVDTNRLGFPWERVGFETSLSRTVI